VWLRDKRETQVGMTLEGAFGIEAPHVVLSKNLRGSGYQNGRERAVRGDQRVAYRRRGLLCKKGVQGAKREKKEKKRPD